MSDHAARRRSLVGWTAVAASTVLATMWAYWGIIENFHEGWYNASLTRNLGMLLAQYLRPMLLFVTLAGLAIRWPRVSVPAHVLAAGLTYWALAGANPRVVVPFICAPLVLMGVAYAYGRPEPRRRALALAVGVPLVVMVVAGVGPAWRVAHRFDDGDRGLRVVQAPGAHLQWAPAGPGWPEDGVTWDEAVRRCRHLTADGLALAEAPLDLWRLPTVDEVVASLTKHNRPAGGRWDPAAQSASFTFTPDKEPPLWNPRSKVVYWWTATEAGPGQAIRVVYNGQTYPTPKSARWGYLAFRAVRSAEGGRS